MNNFSDYFENVKTKKHWEKIQINRRAGVVIPLFSIYSDKSYGIGDFYDLKQIIKWCNQTGISIIQLLPLNDVGSDFSPYNSVSSFALDPMYISIKDLKGVNYELFKPKLKELKKKFKNGNLFLDYEIKSEKIKLLREIFSGSYIQGQNKFIKFKKQNKYWLDDYVIFKVLRDIHDVPDWERWDDNIRLRDENELAQIYKDNENQIEFYKWVQWQLCEQLSYIKKFANENSVLLIGDIPFLVSRDSADVWSHQNYFRLNLSSGAPPDMYLSLGQRWGMPPYIWENVEADKFSYIKEKIKYASKFYNLYRIDHFVGVFRIWSIDNSVPEEMGGLQGSFVPQDENIWEAHGRKIIDKMLEIEDIMPCAEDLGTVPDCSYRVLEEYGIPGIDVQRWKRDWNNTYNFIHPDEYRINSVATLSTHDSSSFIGWWKEEAGTADEELFRRLCYTKNIIGEQYLEITDLLFNKSHPSETRLLWKDEINSIEKLLKILKLSREECYDIILLYLESFNEKNKFIEFLGNENYQEVSTGFQKTALGKTLKSNSIFAINLFNEWLSLYEDFLNIFFNKNFRFNYPGIRNNSNWKMVIPVNVDSLQYLSINKTIKQMIEESGRNVNE
ncbi:MAG: 4-alpha-glucanotransferase [Ignavibacteria bacterium]|nr:4-alpha-glucanotransferase [Ignavibacteria bacterium]